MDDFIKNYQNEDYDTIVIDDLKSIEFMNKNKKLKIMQMNIRSMQMNFNEFELFLQSTRADLDIIVLIETFQLEDPKLFSLNGYHQIYNGGKYNINDGTVVYIEETIDIQHSIVRIGKIKALELDIHYQERNLKLTAMYKSPHYSIAEFNEELMDYLERNKRSMKHIITGDMNINLLSHDYNTEEIQEYTFLFWVHFTN